MDLNHIIDTKKKCSKFLELPSLWRYALSECFLVVSVSLKSNLDQLSFSQHSTKSSFKHLRPGSKEHQFLTYLPVIYFTIQTCYVLESLFYHTQHNRK